MIELLSGLFAIMFYQIITNVLLRATTFGSQIHLQYNSFIIMNF